MNEKEIADIIDFFYPEDDDLKRTLLKHSRQVTEKALELAAHTDVPLDLELLRGGAMLHDVGIRKCHAPGIFCTGELHYLRHGIEGAFMLRAYAAERRCELEPFARICERHTGSGLTEKEIIAGRLPLPPRDYLPETPEEKLICLADKFFSKSGRMEEKPFEAVRKSMARFGQEPLARFDALCAFFKQ